jgi:hypothetical protein
LSLRVATRRPHGHALVANRDVAALPGESSSAAGEGGSSSSPLLLGAAEPLVPPVLLARFRGSRCAWCLSRALNNSEEGGAGGRAGTVVWSIPGGSSGDCLYAIRSCGHPDCDRALRESAAMGLEREALTRLHRGGRDPPAYLPVAVLAFRIVLAASLPDSSGGEEDDDDDQKRAGDDPRERRRGPARPGVSWEKDVEVMLSRRGPQDASGSDDGEEGGDDDGSREHARAVIRTVQVLCRAAIEVLAERGRECHEDSSSSPSPNRTAALLIARRAAPGALRDLRTRIRVNAFGIGPPEEEDPGEDVGLGVFRVAHFANHSCRPAARASPRLRPGRLPRLEIVALPSPNAGPAGAGVVIRAHDEVTLSYVPDQVLSLPREERRARVMDAFGFPCGCDKCRSRE